MSLTTLLHSQSHLPPSFTQCKLASPPSGGSSTLQWMRFGGLLLSLSCLTGVTGSALERESDDGHWETWVSISPVISFPFFHSHHSFFSNLSMVVASLAPEPSVVLSCLWGMLLILFLTWNSLPLFSVGFTLTLCLFAVL